MKKYFIAIDDNQAFPYEILKVVYSHYNDEYGKMSHIIESVDAFKELKDAQAFLNKLNKER